MENLDQNENIEVEVNEEAITEQVITEHVITEQVISVDEVKVGAVVPPAKRKSGFFRRMAAGILIAAVAGGSVGFGAGAGSVFMQRFFNTFSSSGEVVAEATFTPAASEKPYLEATLTASNGTVKSVSDVYKEIADSVVSISMTTMVQSYFGNRGQEQTGSGSGVIFAEDSEKVYIITNYHVIDGANKVTVSIDDNLHIPANYIGGDSQNDIAVISMLKSELAKQGIKNVKLAAFGDSDKVEVGDTVIAVGNALGSGKIATLGIISAVDKSVTIEGKEMEFVQTDAAINPGNSGGPLVNANAEVIAINTAKISAASYGVEGIGFSIPSNTVKDIVDVIMGTEVNEEPYIGVSTGVITEEIKEAYSLPSLGLYVEEVVSGSGAANAGIQAGDIITACNGKQVLTSDDLISEILNTKIGGKISITVIRTTRSVFRQQSASQTNEMKFEVEVMDKNAPKF